MPHQRTCSGHLLLFHTIIHQILMQLKSQSYSKGRSSIFCYNRKYKEDGQRIPHEKQQKLAYREKNIIQMGLLVLKTVDFILCKCLVTAHQHLPYQSDALETFHSRLYSMKQIYWHKYWSCRELYMFRNLKSFIDTYLCCFIRCMNDFFSLFLYEHMRLQSFFHWPKKKKIQKTQLGIQTFLMTQLL